MIPRAGNLYRYACTHLDEVERLVKNYRAMAGQAAEKGHCAATIANTLFQLSNKQWNSPAGGEYFAATLACIEFHKLY